MSKIELALPNKKIIEVEAGVKSLDLLERLKIPGKRALAAKLNGKALDLYTPLVESGHFHIITIDTEEGLEILRHSSAHAMAQAVMRLFDNVEFAIGPTIEDGFYYDFHLPHQLSTEDFPAIEAEIKRIQRENLPVQRIEISKKEALEFLKSQNAKFKLELLEEVDETAEKISFYRQGDFTDWCRGPHIDRTGKLKAVKLLNVAGAYWRGDERRDMLQRIYGAAFFTDKELRAYLQKLVEAKKRDHRKLGKSLDLFSLHDVAPGMPFWHHNGWVIVKEIRRYVDELLFDHDYREIFTPQILDRNIWMTSGHWEHYKSNMFFTKMDENDFGVKPMNCPGAMIVYKNSLHSFRELPIRLCEWGVVHRHEKKGMMSGLTRVRAFIQDDAHIFCLPEQIEEEVADMIGLIREVYQKFGFIDVEIELSTRPPDSIGTDEMWEKAEYELKSSLKKLGIDYRLSPGEGAFYGPKIDFHIKDALKRSWQCGTIQLDMAMPERFDLEYVGSDNQRHRPALLHRTLIGAMERFVGLLIEHYGGAFPTWLFPVQAKVLPVSSDKFGDYAEQVHNRLKKSRIRAGIDARDESLNRRIREAQLQKIPYMLVVGERELETGTVSVRRRDMVNLGPMPLEDFIEKIAWEISHRKLELSIEGES